MLSLLTSTSELSLVLLGDSTLSTLTKGSLVSIPTCPSPLLEGYHCTCTTPCKQLVYVAPLRPWTLTPFHWEPEEEHAFQELQAVLTSAPVLILLDYDKPFTLITDASDYATRSILEQEDAFGWSHLVVYFSKSLQPAEQNYEIHDKELLAIVQSLKHFRHYLQGNTHQTKIFLDHANLQYFMTKQNITQWQS